MSYTWFESWKGLFFARVNSKRNTQWTASCASGSNRGDNFETMYNTSIFVTMVLFSTTSPWIPNYTRHSQFQKIIARKSIILSRLPDFDNFTSPSLHIFMAFVLSSVILSLKPPVRMKYNGALRAKGGALKLWYGNLQWNNVAYYLKIMY